MEIEVTITADEYGRQFAVANHFPLFQFDPRNHDGGKQWYFWPTRNFRPRIFETEEFPLEYFKDLCKVEYFLYVDDSKIADSVKIVGGKKLLKWHEIL